MNFKKVNLKKIKTKTICFCLPTFPLPRSLQDEYYDNFNYFEIF